MQGGMDVKIEKNAKPLAKATVSELTNDRTCGFCGLCLRLDSVDLDEKIVWLACPNYLIKQERSGSEHSYYSVALSETGYQPGDEEKSHRETRHAPPAKNSSGDQHPVKPSLQTGGRR